LARAVKAPFPRSPSPQLATLSKQVPAGNDWLHEIKHDGYRILCTLREGQVKILSRGGLDWTEKLPRLAAAARKLPAREAVLDGEIVILRPDGTSDFQALQRTIGGAFPSGLTYYLFDILYGDGYDLRKAPLAERKDLLRTLLEGASEPLRYSDHVRGNGAAVFARACALKAEGIISKLATSVYEPRRTRTWLKIKCARRQEFVVVGYTEPEGSRTGFGALLLGLYDDEGRLLFSGQVGTGFNEETLSDLASRLERIERSTSPLHSTPKDVQRGAHWVAPELVAEVEFTEWTGDGRLRHPSFKGLRFDKPAKEVRRELE
jgi:bifunctional non-homologous end joining protein LigD